MKPLSGFQTKSLSSKLRSSPLSSSYLTSLRRILQLTTPNTFASLIILNRKWRMVSQQAYLYAHHLSRCPSYSAAHNSLPDTENDDSLPRLRRLFAHEIKRNLFEAYLRPKETIINLVSTSISSSSAPGGEGKFWLSQVSWVQANVTSISLLTVPKRPLCFGIQLLTHTCFGCDGQGSYGQARA